MQHASLEDLISLRDAARLPSEGDHTLRLAGGKDPGSELREHVAECPACAKELERLTDVQRKFSALPEEEPPRDLWPQLRGSIERERKFRRLRRLAAAAAVLAAFALVFALRPRSETVSTNTISAAVDEALVDLQERSQYLEAEMRSLEPEGRALRGWQAATIIALEDELESVDDRLAKAETSRSAQTQLELWQHRLQLQDALFQIHVEPAGLRNL